jgi:hypothetical protein
MVASLSPFVLPPNRERDFLTAQQLWFSRLFTAPVPSDDAGRMMNERVASTFRRCRS